jgi:tripartite-type tricarboxylate transporter receptor subunit TctC
LISHRLTLRAAAAAVLLAAAQGAAAQATAYPSKPIRVIVPFPAGGSADLVARSVGQKFLENTRQPFIVENRAGADTIIAMEAVKSSPADGYTVGYAIGSALTMNPTLYSKLPYDPARDFTPVMVIANVPLALAVHPSLPVKNVQELAALIKAKPGEIFYGQANIISKVAIEAFSLAAGGKMSEVAYKGSTPALQAIVAGEVKVTIEPVVGVLPHVQSGKLRALAATGSQRSPAMPDLPTVAETGLAGYAFNNWHAILLPANAPADVVQKLHAEIVRAARDPEVVKRVAQLGVEIVAGTPEELRTRATTEREYWSRQIRTLGIKID